MTSLLDLPFPLFNIIDAGLGVILPAAGRLVVWGAFAGAAAMGLYALVSNQARIGAQKAAIRDVQGRLKAAQDDFGETMRLSKANLGASFKLLRMVTGPALLSSLPLVFLLVWVAEAYAYRTPAPGDAVPVAFTPPAAAVEVRPAGAFAASPEGGALRWPAEGTIELRDGQGQVWAAPADGPMPPVLVHKRLWWNWIYGNPAGYLRDDASLEEVRFTQTPQDVLGFGPGWLRGWELVFFLSVVVASLTTKRLARID